MVDLNVASLPIDADVDRRGAFSGMFNQLHD
jgi:hypothetical protein